MSEKPVTYCAHNYRCDEYCAHCCVNRLEEGLRGAQDQRNEARSQLAAAQERIAALEHRQEHCRATLELTGSWLAISPQASLEWIESLGEEILAALDECAADPLPCQERIAALEAELARCLANEEDMENRR